MVGLAREARRRTGYDALCLAGGVALNAVANARVLREAGFSPLGSPHLRGMVYTIGVIGRRGEDGQLVIDARNGRIVRFTPAGRLGGNFDEGPRAFMEKRAPRWNPDPNARR